MPPNAYPSAVVDIRIDPSSVDVNIHPTKSEVRFESPTQLFALVRDATQAVLANFPSEIYVKHDETELIAHGLTQDGETLNQKNMFYEKQTEAFEPSYKHKEFLPAHELTLTHYKGLKEASTTDFLPDGGAEFISELDDSSDMSEVPATRQERSKYNVIGQLANMYILCDTPSGDLMIIDQHIAHERVLYEKYSADRAGTLPSMALFEAVVVKLDDDELSFLTSMTDELAAVGYTYELFGGRDVKITRAPVDVLKKEIGREFTGILQDAMGLRKTSPQDCTTLAMSCRNAVKAGESLNIYTMRHLVDSLFRTRNPHTCPHGRPIIYVLPAADLAKKFHR